MSRIKLHYPQVITCCKWSTHWPVDSDEMGNACSNLIAKGGANECTSEPIFVAIEQEGEVHISLERQIKVQLWRLHFISGPTYGWHETRNKESEFWQFVPFGLLDVAHFGNVSKGFSILILLAKIALKIGSKAKLNLNLLMFIMIEFLNAAQHNVQFRGIAVRFWEGTSNQ